MTEFQAEILENKKGDQFVAAFPAGVTETAQYGTSVKARSVYLSQFQLIVLARVRDYFKHNFGMPISQGSVVNFNALAYSKLDWFKEWAKNRLIKSGLLNADETGVNIDGTLQCLSRDKKRGTKAMNNMGRPGELSRDLGA